MLLNDTIAAVATPPGKGGIAVIRLSGAQAYEVAARVFIPKNRNKSVFNCSEYSALFGAFYHGKNKLDEGIALCFRAPNSYTGEDVIEFSCHGSEVVCREILNACYEAGARPAMRGEYTKRAYLNGRMTLTQAEAVMDLVSAASRRGAQAAERVLTGGLQKKIEEIRQSLLEKAGHLAAWIDYPEEDVEAVEQEALYQTLRQNRQLLDEMIDKYDRGIAIKRGIHAVIIGSPNVGKSTLFNLLAGADRSIVTDIEGTTRDVVREEIHIGGMPFFISDTAGLRDDPDVIEAEGIKRSYNEMQSAELVIAVFDGSKKLEKYDYELAEFCAPKNAVAIINKSDLPMKIEQETLEKHFSDIFVVSAKNADAREIIENAVLEKLGISDIDPDMPLLANERQLCASQEARQALLDAEIAIERKIEADAVFVCIEDALQALSKLTGENATEEIIEEVFSKFCVGK